MNQLKVVNVLEMISKRCVRLLSWVVNVSLTEAIHSTYRLSGSRQESKARTHRVANKLLSLCNRIAGSVLCESSVTDR